MLRVQRKFGSSHTGEWGSDGSGGLIFSSSSKQSNISAERGVVLSVCGWDVARETQHKENKAGDVKIPVREQLSWCFINSKKERNRERLRDPRGKEKAEGAVVRDIRCCVIRMID